MINFFCIKASFFCFRGWNMVWWRKCTESNHRFDPVIWHQWSRRRVSCNCGFNLHFSSFEIPFPLLFLFFVFSFFVKFVNCLVCTVLSIFFSALVFSLLFFKFVQCLDCSVLSISFSALVLFSRPILSISFCLILQ